MNCIACGVSVHITPLRRTNPKGQSDAGWTCYSCLDSFPCPNCMAPIERTPLFDLGNGKTADVFFDDCPNCGHELGLF